MRSLAIGQSAACFPHRRPHGEGKRITGSPLSLLRGESE